MFYPKHIVRRILFLASADDYFCVNDSKSSRSRTARFTSQIDRHWREIALAQPVLWVCPVQSCWHSQPPWIGIVLQRSNPLSFDAIIPEDASQDSIRLALRYLRRMRVLEFKISTPEAWVQAETALRQQTPLLLEKCSINVSLTLPERRRRQLRLSSSSTLFCGDAPMLKEFRANNYPVDLTSRPFCNLRVLVIQNIQLVPTSHLLDVLRNITGLEELDITRQAENVNSRTSIEAPILVADPILMSSMRKLSVCAPISACADIFRNLSISRSCNITLRCHNSCPGRDLQLITSRLEKILRLWRCDQYMGQLSVSVGESYIAFSVQGSVECSTNQPPSIQLEVSWPGNHATTLGNFFTMFPQVESLFRKSKNTPDTLALFCEHDLVSAPDVSSALRPLLQNWIRQLDDATQRIIFMSHDSFDLFGPLLGPPHCGLNVSAAEALLSELGDLIIKDINFQVHRRQWNRLHQILQWRQTEGFPIHDIEFVRCVGNYIQRIPAKYGIEVKVDGMYLSSHLESDEDSDSTALGDSD